MAGSSSDSAVVRAVETISVSASASACLTCMPAVSICSHRVCISLLLLLQGARCSSVVRAFAHGAMGRRIDPSSDGPIELFLVPAIDSRLV